MWRLFFMDVKVEIKQTKQVNNSLYSEDIS